MRLSIDRQRVAAALEATRSDLLAQRTRTGYWVGELSSSPLSTATAISALVIAEQYGRLEQHGRKSDQLFDSDQIFQSDLSELIVQSLHWLACHQNEDGGWGDTDKSRSNIAATMLVKAAFHLTGVPAKYSGLLERTDAYIRQCGGVAAVRKRYGRDRTFAVPILTNCALAGLVPWKEVPPLPFELAAFPQSWHRALRLPVVSFAIPALVAIGQAIYHHRRPWNPVARAMRRLARTRSLKVVEKLQPESGGFLESTPVTSFVVMSLASIGLAEHKVVRRGVEFLLASVRGDGSWPMDTNIATTNTTLAIHALRRQSTQGSDFRDPETRFENWTSEVQPERADFQQSVDWLLACQHRQTHPHTGAIPGGWAWTHLSGGVPDVADTSSALIALAGQYKRSDSATRRRIEAAVKSGIPWLLKMQHQDGGWPTFCRGWGHLPFDRSASDLTANALRALHCCKHTIAATIHGKDAGGHIDRAIEDGIAYLRDHQREDGSWVPLWFGNQENPDDENPVYGTARVLIALADLGYESSDMARRALEWLCRVQHASGGWGPVAAARVAAATRRIPAPKCAVKDFDPLYVGPSVEETALAVTALLRITATSSVHEHAAEQGLAWLVDAVDNGRHLEPAPIGFYFAKMWYYERLYPRIFATEALELAACALSTGDRIGTHFQASPLQAASP
jgi:squalene-hopene/tetraprenyl-beta-curcumene cyclase